MSTREFLAIVRRRAVVLVLLAVIGVAAAAFTMPDQREVVRFRATATVAVLATRTPAAAPALEPVSADIAAVVATLGDVPARVAARLSHEGDPRQLADLVSVRTETTTQTLELSVTHADGARAAEVANAFANELLAVLEERREAQVRIAIQAAEKEAADYLNRLNGIDARIAPGTPRTDPIYAERDVVARQYSQAVVRLDALGTMLGPGSSRLTIVQEAVPRPAPPEGWSPPAERATRLAVGGFVGILVGVAVAMVLEKADPHVLTRKQAEDAVGAPVLVEVPYVSRSKRRSPRVHTVEEPRSPVAEAYRNLRTALLFAPAKADTAGDAARSMGILLVVSPGPGEGKSTCVANLAASFAELGRSVVVVGGDIRKPTVHEHFGVPNNPGLTDVARRSLGAAGIAKAARPTGVEGVTLVPSGKPADNPAAVMASLREPLDTCRSIADVVVVDTPPLLLANDARDLLAIADAVVVVVRAGRTTLSGAAEAGKVLRQLDSPTAGVVFIGDASGGGYGRYGRYGRFGRYGRYGSYYQDNGDGKADRRAAAEPVGPRPRRSDNGEARWDPQGLPDRTSAPEL